MRFESIIGQERAVRLLSGMLRKDRLPHALLFTGVDGVGRQTTAKALAMVLNCKNPVDISPCEVCSSCKKILSDNHPDVIIVRPEGAFIRIDQVRSLRKQLRFSPMEGRRRVIIINDGQAMNAEASNALLKILEEPPHDTHIILTALQITDLLPTVVSRCHPVSFRPIPAKKIAEALVSWRGLDHHQATALSVLAGGSLGKALASDPEEWAAWRHDLLERLASMGEERVEGLFAFSQTLAHDKDRLEDALGVLGIWFRDLMVSKFLPESILNRDFAEEIQASSEKLPVHEVLQKITAVAAARRAVLKHANPRLVLDVLMMRLFSNVLPV
jgi:DNA polymerase-3 subunit delta'